MSLIPTQLQAKRAASFVMQFFSLTMDINRESKNPPVLTGVQDNWQDQCYWIGVRHGVHYFLLLAVAESLNLLSSAVKDSEER